ncbi:MAG: Asp-tRNA(Asn)/Glu-tRNA(Gln) amidotransferase subunit GatC, partial [Malacoplasma sp.]|nr:Asp-tRNA(Asn)/Glu-tRNA(Gln) amidotransferase subunit GatC [Malacoplasma sp.]
LMLNISETESENVLKELENEIKEFSKLNELDVANVDPMNYPEIEATSDFREDVIEKFENRKELLDCAKEKKDDLIKV